MSSFISSSPSKIALMATRDFYLITTTTKAYLSYFRRLSFAASPTSFYPDRLVPNPPDLINWVRKEGGSVHPSARIAERDPYGLGLVASEEIPKGSDLIALPHHIPLRFGSSVEEDGGDDAYSVLVSLAGQVSTFCAHLEHYLVDNLANGLCSISESWWVNIYYE